MASNSNETKTNKSLTATNKIPSRTKRKTANRQPKAENQTTTKPKTTSRAQTSASKATATSNGVNRASTAQVKNNANPTGAPQRQTAKGYQKPKKKAGKFRIFIRTFMIILMIAYGVVMGIVGIWAFNNFFGFYFTEPSPVMGANTENSRIENTPKLTSEQIKQGEAAIIALEGHSIQAVTITQVGPSIHFYIITAPEDDVNQARANGHAAVITFADTIGQPEMFGTYEADIIVAKKDLPALSEEQIYRPADQDGDEQAFPQFGVSNVHTDGANKGVSWGRNGE